MLGKLIKWEFRATKRIMIPASIAVLIVSILNVILINLNINNKVFNFITGVSIFLYVISLVAIFAIPSLLIIYRFFKGDLSNEGYLTHTLPINIRDEIFSKLIVGTIWLFIAAVISVIALFMVALVATSANDVNIFNEIGTIVKQITKMIGGGNFFMFVVLMIVTFLASCIQKIFALYACMAVGFSAKKHKIAASFGAYIGLSIILVIAMNIFSPILNIGSDWFLTLSSVTQGYMMFLCLIGLCFIISIPLYFITKYFLEHKLNLE